MKYCIFGNSLVILTGFIGLFLCAEVSAQNTAFSPYSRFGIGLIMPPGTPVHTGMGGTVATAINPLAINTSNPASYAWLQKPTFDIGAEGRFITLEDNSGRQSVKIGALNSLLFAFPMPRKPLCFSFGLRPYSSSGYQVAFSEERADIGKVNYTYSGNGGINVAQLGFSYGIEMAKAKRDSGSTRVDKLAFGANFLAYFGALENTAKIQFSDPSFLGTRVTERTAAKDIGFNAGVIYRKTLSEKFENKKFKQRIDLTLGAYTDLGQEINANYSRLVESYQPTTGLDNIIDTSFRVIEKAGFFNLPGLIGAGVSVDFVNAKGRSLIISAEGRIQDWSVFRQEFDDVTVFSPELPERREAAVGIQFTPRDFYTAGIHFFERLNYRIGARAAQGTLSLSGQQIDESAVSGGLSIPLKWSGSRSTFNLGTEVGLRGTTGDGLVKESFVRLNIGFTLTPYFGNQWFVQRKYD